MSVLTSHHVLYAIFDNGSSVDIQKGMHAYIKYNTPKKKLNLGNNKSNVFFVEIYFTLFTHYIQCKNMHAEKNEEHNKHAF